MLSFPARGQVAEWLCSGLQSRVRRFDSDLGLQSLKHLKARVAEQVDARDLKSLGRIGRPGSIPGPGTNKNKRLRY